MHPVIEEMLMWRQGEQVRYDVQRRWQQALREEVGPMLDRVEALERENAELKATKRGKAA